jgi:hypothetical protein
VVRNHEEAMLKPRPKASTLTACRRVTRPTLTSPNSESSAQGEQQVFSAAYRIIVVPLVLGAVGIVVGIVVGVAVVPVVLVAVGIIVVPLA